VLEPIGQDMVSRILVPMDDSEHAAQALEYAFDTFPDAEVTVLHVVGVPSSMMGEATGLALADDIDDAAAELAEPVFNRANELAAESDREINTVVGIGRPTRNIIDRAEGYDTVVIGSHGKDWSRASHRFLVGNVAETVSKRAPVPVILVR